MGLGRRRGYAADLDKPGMSIHRVPFQRLNSKMMMNRGLGWGKCSSLVHGGGLKPHILVCFIQDSFVFFVLSCSGN